MDNILGGQVSKLEIVPESEEARPANRVQIGFGRRLDTRTRHGGDGAPQSPKRGGRIAGQGKRLHPVDPPFPGPAARAIQKNAPDRASSGICVRRHRTAPPSGQALAYASQGQGTGRDALRPLPCSPDPHRVGTRSGGRRVPVSPETRAGRGERPSLPSLPRIRAAGSGRSAEETAGRIPGMPRPDIRGPLTPAAAGPNRQCSTAPWQRLGRAPTHPCAGGPQYRNILLILMTKPRLRRSHPRSGLSPPVTSR